ncbi:hypothetical protein SKAU_G00397410 [Synaphobranchus kaupii]|uniref:Uncharacterized protein n=1 Tax=Synaphobranchus kaupii TaxID=118154 RepID=A0A9Q1E8I5_SYNKA|nr:hypothetical protein SKAU_G00397410 [Synaphobranchus kaupii]
MTELQPSSDHNTYPPPYPTSQPSAISTLPVGEGTGAGFLSCSLIKKPRYRSHRDISNEAISRRGIHQTAAVRLDSWRKAGEWIRTSGTMGPRGVPIMCIFSAPPLVRTSDAEQVGYATKTSLHSDDRRAATFSPPLRHIGP